MKEKIKYPYRVRLVKYLGRAIQDTRKNKKMRQSDLAALGPNPALLSLEFLYPTYSDIIPNKS